MDICERGYKVTVGKGKPRGLCKIGFTHRHGNFEGSLPVPGWIQKFIRRLFCKEIQLDKLGVIEHKLDLQVI